MKVVILTDLEGISLVDSIDCIDTSAAGHIARRRTWEHKSVREEDIAGIIPNRYQFACERLLADTNAAIAGAADAGATEIYIADCHGGGGNMPWEGLDPRGTRWDDTHDPALMAGAAACVKLGLHAMAGTANAFLDHTMNSTHVFNYMVDGVPFGELYYNAIQCGMYGVPLVAASGDAAAEAEFHDLLGDRPFARVKTALCRNQADCIPGEEALALIRQAVREGIERRADFVPLRLDGPYELSCEYLRTDFAEMHLKGENYRKSGRVIARKVAGWRSPRDLIM